MSKKLLQINTACNTGSTGRIAENIGVLADKRGWHCYIAHSKRYALQTKLVDISTSKLLYEKSHYAAALFTDGEGLFSKSSTRELLINIEKVKPDIIHLHNIHGHYINYPLLFEYIIKCHSKPPLISLSSSVHPALCVF